MQQLALGQLTNFPTAVNGKKSDKAVEATDKVTLNGQPYITGDPASAGRPPFVAAGEAGERCQNHLLIPAPSARAKIAIQVAFDFIPLIKSLRCYAL